jgi:hypothetical protein
MRAKKLISTRLNHLKPHEMSRKGTKYGFWHENLKFYHTQWLTT